MEAGISRALYYGRRPGKISQGGTAKGQSLTASISLNHLLLVSESFSSHFKGNRLKAEKLLEVIRLASAEPRF